MKSGINKFAILRFGVLGLFFVGVVYLATPLFSQEQNETAAEVYFKEPVEINDALEEMGLYDIRTSMIVREYTAGQLTYTSGYNIEQEKWQTVEELRALFWQSHGAMIADKFDAIKAQGNEGNETETESWQEFVNRIQETADEFAAIDGCWEALDCPEVQIIRLSAFGTEESFQKLADESEIVDKVEIEKPLTQQDPVLNPEGPDSAARSVATNISISTWLPRSGAVYIQPSNLYGKRSVTNTIRWKDVSGFNATSTYEHDFFLNDAGNYGPGTYLDDSQQANGVPIVDAWDSSLPNFYLDTRVGDPSFIKSFTIGSANGDAIQAGTTYDSYIRTVNGDATIDNGYLQAQFGYRSPSSCYTTWCVYGSKTVNIYDPETYDIDPIPGNFPWTLRQLNETIWRGNNGWGRSVAVEMDGSIQWGIADNWDWLGNTDSLPGSGTLQSQVNYRIGNNLVQGIWRGNQGWTRNVPIVNDVIQWNQAPGWSGPIGISGLPGSGDMQAHGDYAVGNTLVQGVWRNNQGWTRNVPIVNGSVQWNQAGNWGGPIGISGLPGSGDMQAQDNFVTANRYWQVIWRSNNQYTRSVPIVNGVIQWGQASSWTNTTLQENVGSGTVQTQANYVFP
ncbi:MAG: hypothetical protein KDD92_19955 [Caldilineaceae bacterium]|nr:hypothetical protein [Caldilineaceae bacterium]